MPAAAGEAIPLSGRIMQVAATAVLFAVHAGGGSGCPEVRRRAGSYLDPELGGVFVAGPASCSAASTTSTRTRRCSTPSRTRCGSSTTTELEAVARTFGDLVDLKSP